MTKKIGIKIITAMAFAIVAIAVCLAAIPAEKTAFADEKADKAYFSLDENDYVLVIGKSAVTVYFDNPEANITCSYFYRSRSSNSVVYTFNGYYFNRNEDYETENYRLFLTFKRAEDENYYEFSSTVEIGEQNVNDNYVPVDIPRGQLLSYTGTKVSIDGAEVFSDGQPADLIDAGTYDIKINCGGSLGTVHTPLIIKKATVTVRPKNASCVYGNIVFPKDFDVSGYIIDADIEYVRQHSSVYVPGLAEESGSGEYVIKIDYSGEESPNYDVKCENGVFTIKKASLYGFTFEDITVLYDGLPHRRNDVSYDKEKWTDITVIYTVDEITEVGKYRCSATVTKPNYNDLVLSSYITIKTPTLRSNNLKNTVSVTMADGFDPTWEVRLENSTGSTLSSKVDSVLTSDIGYKDTVKGLFDINFYNGDDRIYPEGEYSATVMLDGVGSAEGVKLFVFDGNKFVQAEYVFKNGSFTFDAKRTDGILFVITEKVPVNNLTVIIIALIIGFVILIVLAAIIQGLTKSRKEKRRWRKRRNKWV